MWTWRENGIVLVEYGPVSMRILARKAGRVHREGALAAARRAERALNELAPWRAAASRNITLLEDDPAWPEVLRLMVAAARATGDASVTPLVAVAGSIAELALRAALAAGAGTVAVENGGDIAVAVEEGDTLRVGVVESLTSRRVSHVLPLAGGSGIGGICTSGLGGRSFTRGIADAAVAVAATASLADACATLLANAVYVDDPAVEQRPAGELDPDSDIAGLPVTVRVGALSPESVARALRAGKERAEEFMGQGLIRGALLSLRGQTVMLPPGLAEPVLPP